MLAVQRKLDENNLFLEQDECCQFMNMWSLLHSLSLLVIHVLIKMSMSTDQFTIHRQIISNESLLLTFLLNMVVSVLVELKWPQHFSHSQKLDKLKAPIHYLDVNPEVVTREDPQGHEYQAERGPGSGKGTARGCNEHSLARQKCQIQFNKKGQKKQFF